MRSLWRTVRTPRGALFVVLGLIIFVPWLFSLFLPRPGNQIVPPETLRRVVPAILLLYCVTSLLFSRTERGINFSPAEVNWLFCGPFSRRELLAFKLLVGMLVSVPSTFVLTLAFHAHAPWFLAAYCGMLLMLVFLQLFLLTLYFTAITVGKRSYTWSRRTLLLVSGGIVLTVLALSLKDRELNSWQDVVALLENSTLWQMVRWPLLSFVNTFLADNWATLLEQGCLALVVNGLLLGVVFLLDAQYLESAAANSERLYARLQRFRRGEAISLHWSESTGPSRWSLPMLPRWSGLGPLAWRQTLTATRSLSRLALVGLVLGPVLLGPILAMSTRKGGDQFDPSYMVAAMVIWLSIVASTLLPFDFRGDLDRMEVLKTLPIPAWRLVLGQLFTPVVLLTTVQVVLLMGMMATLMRVKLELVGAALFTLPINLLIFALDNLLFLLFPGRLMATPGDFQTLGRNVLYLFLKMIVLLLTATVAGVAAWVVYLLSQENWLATLATAWVMILAVAICLFPLLTFAFHRFDVSRDVPVE